MTSKSCFGFSGVGVSQIIGLCSFVGFFGDFGSLDMRSLKATCLSVKAKCHLSISPILLFIDSSQGGGNWQSSFYKTWKSGRELSKDIWCWNVGCNSPIFARIILIIYYVSSCVFVCNYLSMCVVCSGLVDFGLWKVF